MYVLPPLLSIVVVFAVVLIDLVLRVIGNVVLAVAMATAIVEAFWTKFEEPNGLCWNVEAFASHLKVWRRQEAELARQRACPAARTLTVCADFACSMMISSVILKF